MKKFLSALLLLAVIGCNRQKEVVITVYFPEQPEVNMLVYSVPISGTTYLGFNDTLKQSVEGKFELKMKIKQPSFITIWDEGFANRVKLLVEPGNNYQISMLSQKNIEITGANEKGQMLYTTLPDPSFIELELRTIGINVFNFSDTISLTYINQKISELKQSDLSKFKELFDNNEITKSFFDLVQKDRDCYYASLEARFSLLKLNRLIRNELEVDDDLLENLKKIYTQYPPNDENLLFSSFWREYTALYESQYKQFIENDFELDKYLNAKALEFFRATHIHFTCFQGSFDKELISLFEQFENDYPKSEYSRFLKPYIEKIIDYHRIIEQPFDTAVLFLENYENIDTFEEAIEHFRGKKIYVDVWAQWCGPCIREFTHNEALTKILSENDVQLFYISIDRDNYEQEWKNAIKYYNLTGTHIRANEVLYNNLMKLYSPEYPLIAIPWYLLIDEDGNIMERRAKSPSQLVSGEKLLEND